MASPTKSGDLKNPLKRGFTLIELMVVMAIIAMLLTIALPRYFGSVDKSKEAVLRQDLAVIRDALDKHYGDTGKYPAALEDLVKKRYLRAIPPDPITDSAATWVIIPPPELSSGGIYSIRSGALGNGSNGKPYAEW